MPQRLPRVLLAFLGAVAIFTLGLSVYLERYQLPFLQNHPISVNLISSVIGFTAGASVVAMAFSTFITRDLERRQFERNRIVRNHMFMSMAYIRWAARAVTDDQKTIAISEELHLNTFDELVESAAGRVQAAKPLNRQAIQSLRELLIRWLDFDVDRVVSTLGLGEDGRIQLQIMIARQAVFLDLQEAAENLRKLPTGHEREMYRFYRYERTMVELQAVVNVIEGNAVVVRLQKEINRRYPHDQTAVR